MTTKLIINVSVGLGEDYPTALREARRLAVMLNVVVAMDVRGREVQVRSNTNVDTLIVELFGELPKC